ncbi:MAG: hypothetical protein EOM67_12795 [Spirochaetia bacterium]|nr:hypothetical protein [Spirochaetia bacterium]
MAELPSWVLKFKTKGIYVTVKKGKYYLYRGHSERIPGKKYPQLICDEYLGQVTEEDGLISSSPPVKPGIRVLEFGMSFFIYQLTYSATDVIKFYRQREDLLYVLSILSLTGQKVSQLSYEHSWLSLRFKHLTMNTPLTSNEKLTLKRITQQMEQSLKAYVGEDLPHILTLSHYLYAIWVNNGWHMSVMPGQLHDYCSRYHLFFSLGEETK